MSRQACIEILHAFVSQSIPISREGYEFSLSGWTLQPIEMHGEVIGCVMIKENEIHMATKPGTSKHWPRRWMIRQFIGDRLKQYGHMVTSVSAADKTAISIVERLGFYRTGEDEKFIQYRIDHAIIQ